MTLSADDASALRSAVGAAMAMLDLRLEELWTDYVELGGNLSQTALTSFMGGHSDLSRGDYDRLAHAINERFMDRDEDHPLPYSDDIRLVE
jgi:hypothetical protein